MPPSKDSNLPEISANCNSARDKVIENIRKTDDNNAGNVREVKTKRRKKRRRLNSERLTMNRLLAEFQHSPHSLRIPASQVSSVCGLHPFTNLPRLLFDFVYQSHLGQMLLQADAKAVGLSLVTVDDTTHERAQLRSIASKASEPTKKLIERVLDRKSIRSVDQVQSLQKQLRVHAEQAQKDGNITKRQVKDLLSLSRGHVSKGFGTMYEEDALDVYEKRVGCRVRERNDVLMEWKFRREILEDGSVTAVPLGKAERRWGDWAVWKSAQSAREKDDGNDGEDFGCVDTTENESSERHDIGTSCGDPSLQTTSRKIGRKSLPIHIDESETASDTDYDSNSSSSIALVDDDEKVSICKSYFGDNVQNSQFVIEKPYFKITGAVDGIRDEVYLEDKAVTSTQHDDGTNHCIEALKSEDDSADIASPENILDANDEILNLSSSRSDNTQHEKAIVEDTYDSSFDEDIEQWSLRPIIVECKHRMTKAHNPPPLYDQIQTCVYCHMYGVEEADLIQVVRRQCHDKSRDNGNRTDEQQMEITISRICLNDPIHNHQHHWTATLLPRIASFVDAVYNIRRDDGKRFRLLMAMAQCEMGVEYLGTNIGEEEDKIENAEKESWKILWEECPWLLHCDTAFDR
ncbi:hypothetical protein ACHAXS_006747 [Conticribra weissflogii]